MTGKAAIYHFTDKSAHRPKIYRDQLNVITKDFYHISKNTGKCMGILQELRKKGLQVYSVENGIYISEDPPLDEALRAASYTCIHGIPDEIREILPVKNDILKLFATKKTNWILTDQYTDQSPHQRDRELVQLKMLLDNRDKYDILLVHNLNDIHWRTANFFRIREQLHMDIYSLQEGLLKYRMRISA